MGRVKITPDLDIVPTRRDLTDEEYQTLIEEHMKEEENLTEWPDEESYYWPPND